jgi:hypothetical protein
VFIAKKLRKENIAEYLLYMWQIEDTIRAMGCSLPQIRENYISKFTGYTEEQKEDEEDWFGDLIRMMNEEGKRDYGHLNINEVIMTDLVDLHKRLLQSNKFPFYNAEYYKVLPYIVELRSKNKRGLQKEAEESGLDNPLMEVGDLEKESEIETCFDVIYGTTLLKMQGKQISPETQAAVKEISTFVGMLGDYYIKDRDQGLDFGDQQ